MVLSGITGQGCVREGLAWTDHGHTEVTFWLRRITVVADGCQESSAMPRQRQRGSYIKDGISVVLAGGKGIEVFSPRV